MSEEERDFDGFNVPEIDGSPTRIGEPRLTQLDEATRSMVLNAIYVYGYIQTESGPKKEIKKVRYPDLEAALMHGGSHLNMVMNYTWSHGEGELLFWEGLFYDPLSLRYEDDPRALHVLDAINMNLRRSIKGGSIGGSHQDYNVKMVRGHQTHEVINSSSNNPLERKRSL